MSENLSLEQIIGFVNKVNAKTARDVWVKIQEEYSKGSISSTRMSEFKKELDTKAKDIIERELHAAPFISVVKDCEGDKEEVKYGLEAKVPLLFGHYGLSHKVAFKEREKLEKFNDHTKVEFDIDPIEGTNNASLNRPGSYAIAAGIINGELFKIPSKNISMYMNRFIASKRVARLLDKEKLNVTDLKFKIKKVMEAYNLNDAKNIEAVILDRPRHENEISQLQKLGVSIRFIKDGDLAPALSILTNDKPMISLGSGGKEEGMIAAIAAFITGGFFEGKYMDFNGKEVLEKPEILKTKDLIAGDKENAFISLASITGIESWDIRSNEIIDLGSLKMPEVNKELKDKKIKYNISVASISSKNNELKKEIITLN